MNFKQLTRRVNSEEEAVRFFQEHHVLPSEILCENGHQMKLLFNDPTVPTTTGNNDRPQTPDGIVDDILFAQILDYGFETDLATLAIQRTRGIGLEPAVNWIIDHLASVAESSHNQQIQIDGKFIGDSWSGLIVEPNMGSSISTTSGANGSPSSSSSNASSLSNAAGAVLRSVRPPRICKMIFVVNMSLKMGTGKLAAQVGHATLGVYRKAQKTEEGKAALKKWSSLGEVKIVVKGQSTEQLIDFDAQANKAGLFTYLVQDAGYTQIPPGSRTVLGIFGAVEAVDNITGTLKLL